jgi:hypothetical protein
VQFPTHGLATLAGTIPKVNQFGCCRARIDVMRKFLTRVFGLGALAAATYGVWRKISPRTSSPGLNWEPQPFPYPPQPRSEPSTPAPEAAEPATKPADKPAAKATPAPWVDPAAGGTCPASHPLKAKLASGIFHVPGGANYERTTPDRCYTSPEAAIADGLRAAKR